MIFFYFDFNAKFCIFFVFWVMDLNFGEWLKTIKLIIVGIKKIEKLNLKIMYVYGMFFFLKSFVYV